MVLFQVPSNKEITFSLPCYYTIERKKTKVVNYKTKAGVQKTRFVKDTTHLVGLNWFRNAQPFVQNKVKQHYHILILNALEGSKTVFEGKYSTEYKYCFKNDCSDAGNVISIIEKFALDGLKEAGVTFDDNVNYHIKSNGWTVEQDKLNPRVEIIIRECND